MKVKELVIYDYFVCREDTQEDEHMYYGFSNEQDAYEFIGLDNANMNYDYPLHEPRYIYYFVDGDSEAEY